MAHRTMEEFKRERAELTELTLDKANLEIKRFFSLDSQTYREGALPVRTKELLGLVASMVLRCDDCIFYHLDRCHEEGVGISKSVAAPGALLLWPGPVPLQGGG